MTTSESAAPTRDELDAEHDGAIREEEATMLRELHDARSALSRALRSTNELNGPLYAIEWAEGSGGDVRRHIRAALDSLDTAQLHAERAQRNGLTMPEQIRAITGTLSSYGSRYAVVLALLQNAAGTAESLQDTHPDDDPAPDASPA